jgi:hypothetical protein
MVKAEPGQGRRRPSPARGEGVADASVPHALLALQRSAGNAAVADLIAERRLLMAQRASTTVLPPRMTEKELSSLLESDVQAIKSELDSVIYTEGVENAVLALLRKRGEMSLPPKPQATYLDRLFAELLAAVKKGVFSDTTYYDAMFDRFDEVGQLRTIRDQLCHRFQGRDSTSQREAAEKEKAEKREDEVSAEQEGGWTENVGVDTPIPRTPEMVYRTQQLVDELDHKIHLTRQQLAVSRRIANERERGGDGTEWMFHGVHFITAEERNRWKRELAGKVVITTVVIVGTIVTEGLIEMFAPDLMAAIVGAETEAGAAEVAEIGEEVGEGGAAAEEEEVVRVKVHRGQAPGALPVKHGQVLHDFGDGLYLTDSEGVAGEYAELRGAESGSRGEVLSAELDQRVFGRTLDLRSDPRWAEFVNRPTVPGSTTTNEMLIRGANENYSRMFNGFVHENAIDIEAYDTVIGPEYVRGGNQICIRNPEIAEHIRALLRSKP